MIKWFKDYLKILVVAYLFLMMAMLLPYDPNNRMVGFLLIMVVVTLIILPPLWYSYAWIVRTIHRMLE